MHVTSTPTKTISSPPPLCPPQIIEMQLQRATEEVKLYVSSDPHERKKAIR